MTSRNRPLLGLGFLTLGLTGMACATQSASVDSGDAALRTQTQRVESLERELVQREQRIATLTRDLDAKTGPPPVSARPPGGEELFPPAAKPGECYARVFVPATYRVEEERVLRRAASSRIEEVPATYERNIRSYMSRVREGGGPVGEESGIHPPSCYSRSRRWSH